MSKWECVKPGADGISRYPVDGGWLYHYLISAKSEGLMCFVPFSAEKLDTDRGSKTCE